MVGERIGTLTLDNSDVEFTGDQQKYSFEKINGSGSSEIRLIGNDRTLQADDVEGTLGIYSDHAGDGSAPFVNLGGVSGTDSVSVTFGGSFADTIGSEADVVNFFDQNVSITDDTATEGAYTGKIEETATSGEIIYVVDEVGNTTTKFSTSTVADSTKELAALNTPWHGERNSLRSRTVWEPFVRVLPISAHGFATTAASFPRMTLGANSR